MKKIILGLSLIFAMSILSAQSDTLILNNGNTIVGEVKGLSKGVLEIETSYSDKNFMIEWIGVNMIKCSSQFMITTTDGIRYNGSLTSINQNTIRINDNDGEYVNLSIHDVVFLKSVNTDFLSKLSANVDVGYNYAKANNLNQINASGLVGYTSDRWQSNIIFNTLYSNQDDISATKRNSGGITFDYFLPQDFFTSTNINFLTNTEQSIDLRTVASLGLGKYIIHSNYVYWTVSSGFSYLNETYLPIVESDTSTVYTPRSSNSEWFLGTEVNLFNTGDLSFYLNSRVYKTIGKLNRWRLDVSSNVKYDLPLDFYLKAQVNLNYDSTPAEVGKETDYQYSFGLGWEL